MGEFGAITKAIPSYYQIIQVLGAGGMGKVYLAIDTRLERKVAIKCLHWDKNAPHHRDRLRRESKLLAKLNHPSVVQIYDVIEHNEQLMLVWSMCRVAH